VWFARDGNSVWIIALGCFGRRGGRRRTGGGFFAHRGFRLGRAIRIKRLLLRWVLLRRLARIFCGSLLNARGRLLNVGTRTDEKSGKQRERETFHKDRFDEGICVLIRCQSLNGSARLLSADLASSSRSFPQNEMTNMRLSQRSTCIR
jgi:hypothetical protein